MKVYNALLGIGLTVLVGAGIPYFYHGRKSVVYKNDSLLVQTYPLREKHAVVKELIAQTKDACAKQSLKDLEATLDADYKKIQPRLVDLNNKMVTAQDKMIDAGLVMIGGAGLMGAGFILKNRQK